MPMISRTERQATVSGTPLPSSTGDGYSAPGRALQQLGNSISGAIGRMNQDAEEQEMFDAKMKVSEYTFNRAKELDDRVANYDPNKHGAPGDFDRTYLAEQEAQDKAFMGEFKSPKAQKYAALAMQQHRQTQAMRAQNARQGFVMQDNVGRLEAHAARVGTTIDGTPESITRGLQALDGAINEVPGLTPGQRHLMRSKAADQMWRTWAQRATPEQMERTLKEFDEGVDKWRRQFDREEGPAGEVRPGARNIRQDTDLDGRTAAVRYNNPGAQYPSAAAEKFGMTGYGVIGGGHKIAMFPSDVHGGAANMDNFARNYRGMTVASAVAKWRGGNGSLAVPEGFDPGERIDGSFLADRAKMVRFFDLMSRHEGRGKAGAVSPDTWGKAFEMYQAGGIKATQAKAPADGQLTGTPSDETGGPGTLASSRDRLDLPDRATMGDHAINEFMQVRPFVVKRLEEERAKRAGLEWAQGVMSGTTPFNQHDPEGRKFIDTTIAQTDIGARVFKGDPEALIVAGQLSEKMRYVPKPIYDGLKGLTENEDPKMQGLGWTALNNLIARNPNILNAHGDDKAIVQQAEYVQRLARLHGMDKALQIIKAEKDPDSKIHKKASEDDVRKFIKTYDGPAVEKQIANDMDESWWPFSNPDLSYDHVQKSRAIADYKDMLKRHYEATGNETKAKAMATSEFKQTYGVSKLFGSRVMPYPPERFYPAVEGKYDYITEDIKKEVGTYVPSAKLDTIRLIADGKTASDAASGRPTYLIRVEREDGREEVLPGRFRPDPKPSQEALKEKFDKERAAERERRMIPPPPLGEMGVP